MGKSTISMANLDSYVSLPEGNNNIKMSLLRRQQWLLNHLNPSWKVLQWDSIIIYYEFNLKTWEYNWWMMG